MRKHELIAAIFGILALGCVTVPEQPAAPIDETPAAAGEWGYRPESGSVPAMNPPGFTWRPQANATRYALQIARDENFKSIVYENAACAWSAHCPPQALEPGAYFWRFSATLSDGARTSWSTARAFTVDAEAVNAPQPSRDTLSAKLSETNPLLFFNNSDIENLKSLARGDLSKRWSGLVEDAEKILANPPDIIEPPKYPEGMKKGDEGWKEIWWGNRARVIAVSDSAATLAFVYRLGGDEKYAKAAGDLLLALTKWDTEGSTQYQYNDEAAMPFLYYVSRAYSWAYPALSDTDRATIAAMMRVRGRQCYDHLQRAPHLWKPFGSHSNRAWHMLGETAIAFYHDIPEAPHWLDYTMTVMYTTYPVWSDDDGGWHEGTGYWASYIDKFIWWSTIVDSAFGIKAFERPFFQRTGYYGMYLIPPGSETGGFGDMARDVSSKRNAPLIMQLAVGAQNPHWYWYAKKEKASLGSGYLGFIYASRAQDLKSTPPRELPASASFNGVGIAALNTNLMDGTRNIQVLFKSSPLGRQSHGYNANNAFVLNIGGEEALSPSGKRDLHGSKHHTQWMWHSKSDNAILVNGEGQIKHSPTAKGRISAFETTPRYDVVVGEAEESYEGLERWTRRVVFLKPNLVVIHDVLKAKEPSTFEWTLHAPAKFALTDNGATWQGNAGAVRLSFIEPAGLTISQSDQFDPPPAPWSSIKLTDWHLTASAPEKVAQREFLTLIAADLGTAIPEMPKYAVTPAENGARTIAIETESGTIVMTLGENVFKVGDKTY